MCQFNRLNGLLLQQARILFASGQPGGILAKSLWQWFVELTGSTLNPPRADEAAPQIWTISRAPKRFACTINAGIRTTVSLQLLGRDGRPLLPDLCDSKLSGCSSHSMFFVGMECVDQAWVAQEWTCEWVGDEDVAGFE
ncbi:hypothetical protein [Hydrogenophaga sp.]|uniref:hypothetical protein n=1 Tax=Hydrogenophaga sp. TaxID=1904254 RepID=UPI0025B89433|nr:hypothetical protein [Hydrogenophaga sp.]